MKRRLRQSSPLQNRLSCPALFFFFSFFFFGHFPSDSQSVSAISIDSVVSAVQHKVSRLSSPCHLSLLLSPPVLSSFPYQAPTTSSHLHSVTVYRSDSHPLSVTLIHQSTPPCVSGVWRTTPTTRYLASRITGTKGRVRTCSTTKPQNTSHREEAAVINTHLGRILLNSPSVPDRQFCSLA